MRFTLDRELRTQEDPDLRERRPWLPQIGARTGQPENIELGLRVGLEPSLRSGFLNSHLSRERPGGPPDSPMIKMGVRSIEAIVVNRREYHEEIL